MGNKELSKFGENVRALRLKRKYSQLVLAERADSHLNYIGGIERGQQNPSLGKIISIAHALNCRLTDLLKGIH